MEAPHIVTLRKNLVYLKEHLEAGDAMDHLYQEGVLTVREYTRCKRAGPNKCGTLLDLLMKKGEEAYTSLCVHLEYVQPHVKEQLDATSSTEGTTSSLFFNKYKREQEHRRAIFEKEKTISELQNAVALLKKQLEVIAGQEEQEHKKQIKDSFQEKESASKRPDIHFNLNDDGEKTITIKDIIGPKTSVSGERNTIVSYGVSGSFKSQGIANRPETVWDAKEGNTSEDDAVNNDNPGFDANMKVDRSINCAVYGGVVNIVYTNVGPKTDIRGNNNTSLAYNTSGHIANNGGADSSTSTTHGSQTAVYVDQRINCSQYGEGGVINVNHVEKGPVVNVRSIVINEEEDKNIPQDCEDAAAVTYDKKRIQTPTDKNFEDRCEKCRKVRSRFPATAAYFVIHTEDFRKKDKHKRRQILQRLEKIVSALRNSDGGVILIHLAEQLSDDRYLGHFDELVYGIFPSVAEFGEMAIDGYTRIWLNEHKGFENFQDFVELVVKKLRLSTAEFNTRIPSDFETAKPSHLCLLTLLSGDNTGNLGDMVMETAPRVRGIPDNPQHLHEKRNIQLKAYNPQQGLIDTLESDKCRLANYIWYDLRLREYISSMSKIQGGGSYYVGVNEKRVTQQSYATVVPEITGFRMNMSDEELKGELSRLAKANLCVCHKHFAMGDPPNDLLSIVVHPLKNGNRVLEVAIRHFEGIVFFDRSGPISYKVENGTIVKMEWKEWIWRLMSLKRF